MKRRKKESRIGLAVHHTETIDTPWDARINRRRLSSDESETYYRSAHAWQDPEADAETKVAYKFLHHQVGEAGKVGEANIRAAINGIAVLNGARGGTNIPAAERQKVWEHLAAHLKDADREAPSLRYNPNLSKGEFRTFGTSEIRAGKDSSGKPIIEGYAAVFGKLSLPMMGFRELIREGAFSKTILEDDVRALFNHNPHYVLGRSSAGTLEMSEDSHGLEVRIHPPDTQWARDLHESIRRKDIDQMSFGFDTERDRWFSESGEQRRELIELKLWDVSPVTFAAYPDTEVDARSLGIDFSEVARACFEAEKRGKPSHFEREVIRGAMRGLAEVCEEDPTNRRCNSSAGSRNEERAKLSDLLSESVDSVTTEDRPRSEIVKEMAEEGEVTTGTINEILSGRMGCPPLHCLQAFSKVLDVSMSRLQSAAEGDGCDYSEGGDRAQGHMNEKRGKLSDLLNTLVDDAATEDRPRSDIVSELSSSADIDEDTVNEILRGGIECPPLQRLRAFAGVLGVSVSRIQSAAEADGCTYSGRSICRCSGRSNNGKDPDRGPNGGGGEGRTAQDWEKSAKRRRRNLDLLAHSN